MFQRLTPRHSRRVYKPAELVPDRGAGFLLLTAAAASVYAVIVAGFVMFLYSWTIG